MLLPDHGEDFGRSRCQREFLRLCELDKGYLYIQLYEGVFSRWRHPRWLYRRWLLRRSGKLFYQLQLCAIANSLLWKSLIELEKCTLLHPVQPVLNLLAASDRGKIQSANQAVR